ncbi:MAG: DMT family transporter, partial [Pseudomonadota bacterium]|nr:DMT family transporter [Pseudomonadota bacterium]
KRLFIIFLMMSLFNNVIPFNLIAWGQSQITASVSSILNATTPLFTVILAHYWPKGEKATLNRIIGVVVGICGVSILMGFSFDDLNNSIDGQIAILLASVSYAISVLFGKQIDSSIHPAISATMMLCISSIILMPIVIYMGVDFIAVSKIESMIPLLGLSIFSTAVAYLIFYKLIKNIGSNVMLVTLLMPISAIFMSIIFLGESIATQHIIGLILILIGLILVDGRILQRFR